MAPDGRPSAAWAVRLAAGALAVPGLVLGLLATPSSAQGRHGVVERNSFEESFDSGSQAPDPFWQEECGVRVRHSGSVSGVETVFRDGTSVVRIREQSQWRDFDTGRLLLAQKDREVLTETPVSEVVDEQAGTRTVVLEVDYVGAPIRLMKPGSGVVAINAGRLERTVTLVFDEGAGQSPSESVEVDRAAGQWSFLAPTGELDLAELTGVVCRHLTA